MKGGGHQVGLAEPEGDQVLVAQAQEGYGADAVGLEAPDIGADGAAERGDLGHFPFRAHSACVRQVEFL